MQFVVLDVGHGFCAYAEAANGGLIVFDCGHKTHPELRPSLSLPRPTNSGRPSIGRFFITNYDEDHISDLPQLRRTFDINVIHRNTSISAVQLRELKRQGGPISPAMIECLSMMDVYSDGVSAPPDLPGLSFEVYYNRYGIDFIDTNNISVVTILDIGTMSVLVPGDIEQVGWPKLLEQPAFRAALGRVSVFVASHHGRENGYCREVFDYCSPRIVVFSDSEIVYGTQEMSTKYGQHALGMSFGDQTRHVVSTRNDGPVSFWPA